MPRFDDADREAMLDIMPHLIMRLDSDRDILVLVNLFYRQRPLRDIADEYSVHHKTVERWRDSALENIRQMYVREANDG